MNELSVGDSNGILQAFGPTSCNQKGQKAWEIQGQLLHLKNMLPLTLGIRLGLSGSTGYFPQGEELPKWSGHLQGQDE